MEFFNCITLNEAVSLVESEVPARVSSVEEVPLTQALGRVIAEDVAATGDLPPFSRSTVDGYAVLSRDTFGAGEGVPVMLDIIGEVFMGQAATQGIVPGQAVIIPTGGMLPAGADAVVMLEHCERSDDTTLLVLKPVAPAENVIAKGEDIKAGKKFINCGTKITPAEIGAMAACGITAVKVRSRIKVGIISTGDEVVDIGCEPTAGQVRDINSYTLLSILSEAGCDCKNYGIIKDNYHDLLNAVKAAATDNQLVLVSGGSSVGTRDHTVNVIEELGQRKVAFHGVAVKPGKPTIFGMVSNVPVFGLPGHPVAAMTICQQVVIPAVHKLEGRIIPKVLCKIRATLTKKIASAPGRDDFIRVKLELKDGEYRAEPILGKSGLISIMTQADGVVRVSSDCSGLNAGDIVTVELIREA